MGKKHKPEKTKSKSKTLSKRGSTRSYTSEKSYTAVPNDGSETEGSPQPSRLGSGTSRRRHSMDDVSSSKRLRKKPSPVVAPLPTLTLDEYEFFDMVRTGDVNAVQEFLGSEEFQSMDINKTNQFGYTVLHVAVRRQDENMVKLLLEQPGIKLYDTIFHAIREDNMPILKMLLEVHDKVFTEEARKRLAAKMTGSPEELRRMMTSSMPSLLVATAAPISMRSGINSSIKRSRQPVFGTTRTPSGNKTKKSFLHTSIITEDVDVDEEFDSEFLDVVTCLMIAAQTGSVEMMELFYSRDERLETAEFPHNLDCHCDICHKLEGDYDLTRAHQRFELFKSITAPAYICFIARKEKIDPVNYAIAKLIKIRQICEKETAYDTMYSEFIENLEKFLCDLLNLCRNTTEMEIFLSPKDLGEKERLPHHYPRLWYAVGLDLKKFVSHSNFQTIVYKMWATDDWPQWDSYGPFFKFFTWVVHLFTFPIIALILCLSPKSGIGRILGSPISRFMNYAASYSFFLCLVTVQVLCPYQRCNEDEPYFWIRDDECTKRGPPRIGTEWPIIIYVLSFYVSTLKRQSVSWYWSMKWNLFELSSLFFFTVTFVFWGWAWCFEKDNIETARTMWPTDSAEVWGECCLALSTLLAITTSLRFLLVVPKVGPIQVGIGRQINNFVTIGFLYSIVLIGFAIGLLALYVPYKDFKGLDKNDKEGTQDPTFTNFADCLQNLFWFLYGKGGKDDPAYMVRWELPDNTASTKLVHHEYTEYAGLLLYHGYKVVGQMMMFSMLSAYFGKTMEHCEENAETVWKCARTELYLTFIKDTVLPPPFNLIPTCETLCNGINFFKYLGNKDDPKSGCNFRQCCFITESEKRDRWNQLMQGYRKLIVELIFRYNNFRDESEAASDATKDDVLEIGEELAEMKAELEKFRKKGGDGGPDDNPSDGPSKRWPKPTRVLKPSEKSGTRSRTGGGTTRVPSGSKATTVNPSATSTTRNQATESPQNSRSNATTRQPTMTSMHTTQQTQASSRTTNTTMPGSQQATSRSSHQTPPRSSPTQAATAQQISSRSTPLSNTTTQQVRYSSQQTSMASPLSTQQSASRSSPLKTQQTPPRSLTTQQMGSRSTPLSTQNFGMSTHPYATAPSYTTATATSETASQSASVSSAQTTQSRPQQASNTSTFTSQPQPSSVPFSTSTRGGDASFDRNLNRSASSQMKSQPTLTKKASPVITPLMPQPRRFSDESETTDSSTTTPKYFQPT